MKNLLFQVKTLDIDQKKVLFLFNFFLKYLIFCTIEFEILVSLSKGFQKNLLVFQKKNCEMPGFSEPYYALWHLHNV